MGKLSASQEKYGPFRAMTQAVSRWFHTTESCVPSKVSTCAIYYR